MIRSEQHKEGFSLFADALMPGPYQCFLCDEEDVIGDDGLCDDCRAKIKFCPNPTYLAPLDGITVGLQYGEEIGAAVLRFKKNGQKEYARFFAQYLSVPQDWRADIIVPVPMHPIRRWLRGFNHTELLAAYLSNAVQIPFSTRLLFKTRNSAEQKTIKDPAIRRKNIRGSFSCDPRVKGLRIALVDDVFTTGATVYECAKVLKQAGAAKVYLSAVTSPAQ